MNMPILPSCVCSPIRISVLQDGGCAVLAHDGCKVMIKALSGRAANIQNYNGGKASNQTHRYAAASVFVPKLPSNLAAIQRQSLPRLI